MILVILKSHHNKYYIYISANWTYCIVYVCIVMYLLTVHVYTVCVFDVWPYMGRDKLAYQSFQYMCNRHTCTVLFIAHSSNAGVCVQCGVEVHSSMFHQAIILTCLYKNTLELMQKILIKVISTWPIFSSFILQYACNGQPIITHGGK